jgi:membrane protease YdiL (CAAX protease family)
MGARGQRLPRPIRAILFNSVELRSGWRLALFIGAVAVLGRALVSLIARTGVDLDGAWTPSLFALLEVPSLAVTLAATALLARIERRSFGAYGLAPNAAARRAAVGAVWGFVMVAITFAAVMALGHAQFEGIALRGADAVRMTLAWLVASVLIGISEEVLFRGYALFTLASGIRFWPAAIVLSLLFGALHFFGKPNETVMDGINVTLIGLLLCFSIRRTGNLWWAIGYHAAFDFAQLFVFAAPNTGNGGNPVATALLHVRWTGPAWSTGAQCGLEASVFVLPLVALGAWSLQRERAAPVRRAVADGVAAPV